MLRDLTIKNYRCFEDFQIDGLEQVNLFVGNNNSGKTSLLEAIYLLVNPNKIIALIEILLSRGEIIRNIYDLNYYGISTFSFKHIESIKHLFHKHQITSKVKIRLFSSSVVDTPGQYTNFQLSVGNGDLGVSIESFTASKSLETKFELLKLNINHELDLKENFLIGKDHNNSNVYISAKKEELNILSQLWNNVYLTEKETKVVESLKIIEPKIERIGFIQEDFYHTVRLKLSGYNEPIPLSSMGAGMYRILTLAIALVTAENHVLLIDEIETGLHYEAQTDMWRLILATAKELNVQVFATTHSWDCIAAYQQALAEVEDQSIGKLFRLDSKYGKLRAVEYDANDLDIAIRKGIEVR